VSAPVGVSGSALRNKKAAAAMNAAVRISTEGLRAVYSLGTTHIRRHRKSENFQSVGVKAGEEPD
jgi:hypothetical protein